MDDIFSIAEGSSAKIRGITYRMVRSIPRQEILLSAEQEQTAATFAKLWGQKEIYNEAEIAHQERWFQANAEEALDTVKDLFASRSEARVLDAGCGLGLGAYALLKECWPRIDYVGVDASGAVDIAKQWLPEKGVFRCRFIQADFASLPPCIGQFDLILALGTLHHSDSVANAIKCLAPFLSQGGKFIIWVINEQKPLRQVTDEYMRTYFQKFPAEEARDQMLSYSRLTRLLGETLGDVTIDVPEDVLCLNLKKGRIRLQTLIYDYILKAYYAPGQSLDWINMSHFDWFYPKNYLQTNAQEMDEYIRDADLQTEKLRERVNGITAIAGKG